MLKAANDYIPLSRKLFLAQAIAPKCLQKSKTAEQNQKGLEFLALPTIWVDDQETKALYVMSVLLTEYLKIQIPDDFSDQDYDRYGSAHILNQIERFKGNAALKDKVFDLLGDYKKFEKMLNTEIASEKEVRNDPVSRFSAAMAIVSAPENIKKMRDELERTMQELSDARKNANDQLSSGKVETA